MKIIGKRFVALLLVFASIISFLPIDFLNNVQAANAVDVIPSQTLESGQDQSQIKFSMRKSNQASDFGTQMQPNSEQVDNAQVYSQPDGGITNYKLVLNDISLTDSNLREKLKRDADNAYIQYKQGLTEEEKIADKGVNYTMTAIVSQEVQITSINQIDLTNSNNVAEMSDKLGIKIIDDNYKEDTGTIEPLVKGNNQKYWVKTITGVPYGINKITYNVKVKKTTYEYNPKVGTIVEKSREVEESINDQEKLYIYNGTNFANNQVKSLVFDQYVGESSDFDNPANKKNNERPFLYKSTAQPEKDIPLKYIWRVPDSTSALSYNFTFDSKLDSGVNVFVGGKYSSNVNHSDYTISGALTDLNNTSNFIVIKFNSQQINGSGNSVDTMTECYSIELSYVTKNSNEDYTMKKSGITKLDADADGSVEAYIGKEFTHYIREEDNVDIYNGEITIDNRASMVSIEPELVCGKSNVAYSIQNNYIKNGNTGIRESIMKKGKQYVEFNYGDSNTIQLNVYAGDGNGNINHNANEGKSQLLAIYYLKVKTSETTGDFKTKLIFDGDDENDGTYLTQEGVKNNVIPFSPDRTHYNLYTKSKENLEIALAERSSLNEYIRVYYSDSTSGNSFTEYRSSENNNISPESGLRNTVINVEPGEHKRIKVQAYYDILNDRAQGEPYTVKESYPLGEEYIFYLGDNIVPEDNNSTNKSDDATLSNIKIKGETLYDLDENKGFKSETYDYKVKVDRDTKTALLTVTPQDENVKSMVATVIETGEKYDLYSGEETEITLKESGTTSLSIEVTAQDGKTSRIYNVTIVNNTKGGSAKLKNIILSSGEFNFDPSKYETKVSVNQTTKKVTITPIPEDPKAKITVNGEKFSGTAISVDLNGSQKVEVEIVVTSEDGKNSKTYTLIIKRVTSGDYDDDSQYGQVDDSYYDYDNDIWIDNNKYDEWGTTSDGRVVYYDTNGRQVKDKWIVTNDKYYYINKSGYRATGWKVDSDGKTYYLDPKTGEMKTGWIYVDGSTYYLNPRGIMQKGWLNLNNKWYYFTDNGQMLANTSMYIDERLYKFAQDGTMYY